MNAAKDRSDKPEKKKMIKNAKLRTGSSKIHAILC